LCNGGEFEKRYNVKKRVTQPIIVKLNKKSKISQVPHLFDLLKIKGFLVDKINLELLKNEYFILEFKNKKYKQIHKFPFSFLIEMNKLEEINDKYFFDFNYAYFYKFLLPINCYKNLDMELFCEVSNNINIEIIFEYTLIDIKNCDKLLFPLQIDSYVEIQVKQIELIELNYNNNYYENNECDLRNFSDGVIINLPKNMIESIDFKCYYLDKNNNTKGYFDILNYNSELINIYGIELSPTLTYFAFACNNTMNGIENISNRSLGYTENFHGINFFKTDGTSLKIHVKNKINDKLNVYFPYDISLIHDRIPETAEINNWSICNNLFSSKKK